VVRAARSNAYRFLVVASDWRRRLGQLKRVVAWREVEAESIIARRHVIACNLCAAGIEYVHNDAEMTAVKCDRANYRPRRWGAPAPRREHDCHHGTYDDACGGSAHVIGRLEVFVVGRFDDGRECGVDSAQLCLVRLLDASQFREPTHAASVLLSTVPNESAAAGLSLVCKHHSDRRRGRLALWTRGRSARTGPRS
jgi:hypothetical protein